MLENIRKNIKTGVKTLIVLNLFAYMHIFYLYNHLESMVTYHAVVDKNVVVIFILGNFLPYLFLFLTSFILLNVGDYVIFKKDGWVDWIVRLLAYIVVFQYYYFEIELKNDYIVLFILFIFLAINILLEIRMLMKANRHIPIKAKSNIVVTEEELENIENIRKSVTLGLGFGSFIIAFGLAIGSLTSLPSAGDSILRKTLMIIISLCAFGWLLSIVYKKYNLFFTTKALAQKTYLKDIPFIMIAYVLCLLDGFELLGSSEIVSDLVPLIAVASILPMARTMRKMAIRYQEIKDYINENDFSQ